MTDKPTPLFVCDHNADRSQMATGWLKHMAGDRIGIWSAGSEPADQINPTAVQVMLRDRYRHQRRDPQNPHHRLRVES